MSGSERGGGRERTGKRSLARKRPVSDTVGNGATAPREEETVEAVSAVQSSRAPKLVLIVEDEVPIAEALSLVVADAGYSPLVARHGIEALEIVRSRKPSLVITDLMMPRLDGAGLIAAIRNDTAGDGPDQVPPIVLMTAANLPHAREAGADVVLRKPFDIAEVEALLHRFLDE